MLVHFCCFLIGEQERDMRYCNAYAIRTLESVHFTFNQIYQYIEKNDINVAKVIFIMIRLIWLLLRTSLLPNNCSLLSRAALSFNKRNTHDPYQKCVYALWHFFLLLSSSEESKKKCGHIVYVLFKSKYRLMEKYSVRFYIQSKKKNENKKNRPQIF